MESILEFLENNYIWFLVAAAILLLALIGFIVDSKRKEKKTEGNLNTLDKVEEAPVTEMNVAPSVEPANVSMNMTTPQTETSAPVMPQAETPVQEVNNPVEPKVETFSFDTNPITNSQNMTFNDIPTPSASYEMPAVEPFVPKEEIVEPFNIGNPIVMNQAQSFEPVQNVQPAEPIINEPFQTFEPVQPIEPVQSAQQNFTSTEEPIVKIGE